MAKGNVEFEMKIDASEVSKAIKELGVALENLQKASIYITTIEPKPVWYKRFWRWFLNKKAL